MLLARGSTPATTIEQAAISAEVRATLRRWRAAAPDMPHVLIGGLARSFHARPQYTEDIDLLFARELPASVPGFRQHMPTSLIDEVTGVVLDLHSARSIGISRRMADLIMTTAVVRDGLSCASLQAMIALRLHGARNPRCRLQYEQDVIDMISWCPKLLPGDLSGWPLDRRQRRMLARLHAIARLK